MSQRIAPSERKAQELRALVEGQNEARSGGEWLSALVRLSTERILQEALEPEQAEALGRARYERRAGSQGSRNGDENGTRKTAEGVVRLPVPQLSGRPEPVRSQLWSGLANTREVLKTVSVEMYAGGRSQRDIEYSLEKARGEFVLSKSPVRGLTDTLTQA